MKGFFNHVCSLVFLAFFFLAFTTSVQASTYYVSNSGSDTNSGTLAVPWKTLVYAASKLVAGDALYIRAGTYQEKVNFSKSGTASQPIKIAAYQGEIPIIDGNYQIPTSSFSALVVFSGSYIQADGLEVKNSFWQGVEVSGSSVTLSHFTSHDNMEHGIITYGSIDAIVQDSVIYNNAKSFENGVHQFSRTSYATGISAAGGSNRTTLRRNKTYHNWGEGLSTFNATNTTMEDNIVYDNAKQVYVSDTTGTLVESNLIYCTPGNTYRLSSTVTQHGINLQDENQQPASANITIINNMVVGCITNFKWYPFTSNSSMNNVLVANNTFVNATGTTSDAAFFIASPTTIAHINSRIMNNIIEQDDSKAIGSFGSPNTGITFSNNLWSKTPPTNMMGINSIVADPFLLKTGSITPGNLTGDYFKISSASQAMDQGFAMTEVTADYFGTSRPVGAAYDIGAQEYAADSTKPPCPLKKQGDADCKKDSTNQKDVSLLDFEIWRKEHFVKCSQDNLSVCGPDVDRDGSAMDANFNFPGSGAAITDTIVDSADYEIWRKGYFIM